MKVELYYDGKQESTVVRLLEDVEVGGYTIPSGFCSDGCSCPRSLWSYCSPFDGRYLRIFCLHDYLYSTKAVSRKKADKIMRDLLVEAGMSSVKAYSIYLAVRTFGGSHYED